MRDEITEYDFDKLRSTIKQFVRDWSIEVWHGMLKIDIGPQSNLCMPITRVLDRENPNGT